MTDRVIAVPGERVTDEAGRTVCYVAKEIVAHRLAKPEHFTRWVGRVPLSKEPMGPGFRRNPVTGRLQLCIEGEWRPAQPEEDRYGR